MALDESPPSFSVPCPGCGAMVEHSLNWLEGRDEFEFYCFECGFRDDIKVSSVRGLKETLERLHSK